MVWRIDDPQGNEAGKVKYELVRYMRGIGLDMGCGPRKAFPHMIGVDSGKDTDLFGIAMKPDVVCDAADPTKVRHNFGAASVPYVFSSHMLEHVEDYEATLQAWWELIYTGGYLILYLPHADLYPRMGERGANEDHKHDFVPSDITEAMTKIVAADRTGYDLIVDQTRAEDEEYSFLQVYRKRDDGVATFGFAPPRPPKSVCVVRHGGYGDQLQAASLFPQLKREGFHITVLTTPKGHSVLKHDPHIDDWYLVDEDQVPNHELGPFWKVTAKHYDRFINLNESVEGVLLALPGRIQYTWPHALRHDMLNRNYAEHAAKLAQIPFTPEGRFYESDEERAWAADLLDVWRAELNVAQPQPNRAQRRAGAMASEGMYLVMFALSGSSHHKFTPHQDAVIIAILRRLKRAVVVLVGDHACKILEAGIVGGPRVKLLSGEISIRQTLALARQANLVIGPETGVLNSVAYEEGIKKVVLLSHSSTENLVKHWVNTTAVEGVAPCYPCHQIHYSSEACPKDPEVGAAACQVNMNPADIFHPIDADYTTWARVQMLHAA
jgi:ADP-heptose:LPS heptosyltransferase/predicted SAM-dependent methyltransferase